MKQINLSETYQSLESQPIGSEDLNLRLPRTNPASGQGGLKLGASGLQVQRSGRSATLPSTEAMLLPPSYQVNWVVNARIKDEDMRVNMRNFHIFELREKIIIVIAKRKVNCSTEPIGKLRKPVSYREEFQQNTYDGHVLCLDCNLKLSYTRSRGFTRLHNIPYICLSQERARAVKREN